MRKIMLAKDVDDYIAMAPKESQAKLQQLRRIVRAVAPESSERISYGMPYYEYHGMIASFGAFKKHIGFFGALPEQHKQELKRYETSKGTVRFPLDKPLPVAFIKKLVKARVLENKAKMK
jgi:uncharacterized protein YdhG (YjbR/CyaY superfamily)